VFLALFAARLFYKDAAHGLCGGGEEMAAAVPLLRLLDIDQPEVGFVYQGGRLECVARLFLGQTLSGQLPQLLVDQGQELLGGARVALRNGREDASNVIHGQRRLHSWLG
jgi:hypothetical protein